MTDQSLSPGEMEAFVENAYNEGWREREVKPSPMINSRGEMRKAWLDSNARDAFVEAMPTVTTGVAMRRLLESIDFNHDPGEPDGDGYRLIGPAIDAVLGAIPSRPDTRDYPAEFEAWWGAYQHRNRDVADYSMKKQIAFDAFYFAARAKP